MYKFMSLAIVSALSYSLGGYFMKLSAGFSQVLPSVSLFACFTLGTCFQTFAMQGEQMSITYIVVLGFEAMAGFSLSVFLLKESSSAVKLAGVVLILVGISLLRIGSVRSENSQQRRAAVNTLRTNHVTADLLGTNR